MGLETLMNMFGGLGIGGLNAPNQSNGSYSLSHLLYPENNFVDPIKTWVMMTRSSHW